MLNKDVRDLLAQLGSDIPDWHMIYPDNAVQIAQWILEDRRRKRRKGRKGATDGD